MFAYRSLQKMKTVSRSMPRQSFSTFFPFSNLNNTTTPSISSSSNEQSQSNTPHFSTKAASTKKTLTKRQIAEEIANAHDMSVAASARVLDTVIDTIVEGILDGKTVRIKGFGSIEAFMSKERMGTNPSTGEKIQIPSKRRIRFKAGSSLKES